MRYLFTLLLFVGFIGSSFAQTEDPVVIQVSGIVVTGDSAYGVPHVLIYVPKTMRGTETNDVGYFTMPALAGDSLRIQHIGFKNQVLVLPDGKDKQSYTYVIELKADTSELAEISILPYPTFQLFKEAFVNADIPKDENESNWKKNLDKKKLERMMLAMAPSGYESYRTFSMQEIQRMETSNMVAVNPLTNLFAWVELIQTLSERAKKKKKQKEDDASESDF